MTVCGRISPAGIGGPEDREVLERLRDQTDASLIGASTLRDEEPEMRGSGGRLSKERIRAVITCSGNVPVEGKKIFSFPPAPLFFTSDQALDGLAGSCGERAIVLPLPAGPHGLSIAAALSRLGKLGAESVLIEGGGKLNYAALAEGVVDEIFVTIAPKISGNRNEAALASGPKPLSNPFLALEFISCRTSTSGELFCHYRINKG